MNQEYPADQPETTMKLGLRVSHDRMRVLLDCRRPPESPEPLVERVREELLAKGVAADLLGAPLAERVRAAHAAAGGGPIAGAVVATGRKPGPPKDGRIIWAGDFFAPGFVEDERTGAVDFRRHVARKSVTAGQRLATIEPPETGAPGRDIMGDPVPPEPGRWPEITAGPNVSEVPRPDGPPVYEATMTGRIRWDGKALSVDEVYMVDGNVGLETGHIEHPGAVVVGGDIEAGAEVRAAGDVEVAGVVERADVRCGGNLVVHGGIMGRGREPIEAGQRIEARFAIDADLRAGSDVLIEREAMQSRIWTRGAVVASAGRVVGGETLAKGGIIAGQLGSEGLVATTVELGRDFHLVEQIQGLEARMAALYRELDEKKAALEPLLGRRTLADAAAERKLGLERAVGEIERSLSRLGIDLERLRLEARAVGRPRAEIGRRLHPEVHFILGDARLDVSEPFQGPCHLALIAGEPGLVRGRAER